MHPIFRGRFLLAILAGLLWTCAYPKIGIAGLAWLAPGLMIAAALGKPGPEAFRIGYAAGLAHYLSLLYWLLLIPYRWYGIPLGPMLGWLALSGFLALFTGAWVWVVAQAAVRSPRSAVESPEAKAASTESKVQSRELQTPAVLGSGEEHSVLPVTWAGRLVWMMTAAAAWVAMEMVLARIFGGFPWSLLGVSQYQMTPLIQVASVTGVYGVSFTAAWVSMALLSAALMLVRRPTARSGWVAEVFIPLLATAVLFNIGFRQMRNEPRPERTLKVLLVQPSIPQNLIWDPSQDTNRFAELVAYSEQVLTNRTDLLIWPESAIPEMIRYDTNTFNAISNLAQKHRIWMIVGSDDKEPKRGSASPGDADYFNSSFLINPQGILVERYIKRSLVIFGEYVPLQRWLPFLRWFTPVDGGFTAGTESTEFDLNTLAVKTSVLICFEDIFPQLGRATARSDTDFLVNITNDGWFGHSAAQWQHAATALFRAVENRVPLIRCCNNGLTCWIDANGRLRQILRDEENSVYGLGYLHAEVPILGAGHNRSRTFYARHGDVFGWSSVAVTVLLFARNCFTTRQKTGRP